MVSQSLPQIITGRCTRCGRCIVVCQEHVLEMGSECVEATQPDACGGCAHCEDVCPEDAISYEFAIVWDEE
jgi:NAD-dependent dihydropyrimidine dehydrogenase PreA subunit